MNRMNLALLASGLLLAASPASADHRADRSHGYDAYRHVHYGHRHDMPRWLRRHDRFHAWYRYTPLRYNRYLGWDELYSIFLWERRYAPRSRYHHYRHHQYGFDYYRKYWKHDHRKPQHGKRHRYDDRDDHRRRYERYDRDERRHQDKRRRDRDRHD